MTTTNTDIIRALAREDATVNDEPPLAEIAIETWYRDCTGADQHALIVTLSSQPGAAAATAGEIIAAIEALGTGPAAEVYSAEWGAIAAERLDAERRQRGGGR